MVESPPEQVRIARPPSPRGRAWGSASTRASSSSSWKSRAQARAGLLDQRAEDALVAGERAGVGRAAAAPGLRGARPSAPRRRRRARRSAPAPRRAARRRRRTPGTGRPSARRLARRQRGEPVARRRATAWLPVETTVWKPIPRREPSAFTATLPLCEIIATAPGSSGATESPQIGARDGDRDDAVAVRAADGQPARRGRLAQLALELPARLDLAEARGEHDRAAAAALAASAITPGPRPPGSRPRRRRPALAGRPRLARRGAPCTSSRAG